MSTFTESLAKTGADLLDDSYLIRDCLFVHLETHATIDERILFLSESVPVGTETSAKELIEMVMLTYEHSGSEWRPQTGSIHAQLHNQHKHGCFHLGWKRVCHGRWVAVNPK